MLVKHVIIVNIAALIKVDVEFAESGSDLTIY